MLNKLFLMISSILILTISLYCVQEQSSFPAENGFDRSKSDPKALQVVDEMWESLGGKDNWQKIRFLSYHWIVEVNGEIRSDYRHDWDRYTNDYRVEGTSRDGQHFVAIFNTQTKAGDVFVDGTRVIEDSTKSKWIERAYGRYINDSYWLIMPYKLNDPGVVLNYEGEKEVDSQVYDVVRVTFEGVGLTPEDTYWAYIGKTDRLMHKWEYLLQDQEAGTEPSGSWWKEWQTFGNIKLAMSKEFEGRPVRIYFEDLIASAKADREIFQLTSKTF